VPAEQVPAEWQLSGGRQDTGVPMHAPFWHLALVTHALPGSHGVLLRAGLEQTPVAELHVPTPWHWSLAAQAIAVPVQVPLAHLSFVVHASPSSHGVPSLTLPVGAHLDCPLAHEVFPV